MDMKAIILCGGKGTRLHPFTDNLPKPLVPFGGEPLLFRIIDQLIESNIHDVMLTLGYRSEQIKNAVLSSKIKNCNITFSEESEPLGTAGSVLQCRNFITEDTLIISGDCVFEGNFIDFIHDHAKHHALVSIGASSQTDPTEFGCILVDKEQNVQAFIEKPSWEQIRTDLVSTGIYMIKPELLDTIISLGKENCDFAKDVFPKLLENDQKIHVYQFHNYWCDVGTPEAYLSASLHLGKCDDQGNVFWKDVQIGTNTIIQNSVIGNNVQIGNGVIVRNSFIGNETVIEENACVVQAKVDNKMTVAKGTAVTGIVRKTTDSSIMGSPTGDTELIGEISYSFITKLCQCISLFFEDAATIAVISNGGNQGKAIATFVQAGLLACGREVRIGHEITLPAVRWMIRNGLCDGGIYVTNNRIRILNSKGNDLNRSERRKFHGIYCKNDGTMVTRFLYGTETIQNPEEYYYAELIKRFPCAYRSLDYWGKSYTREEKNACIAKIVLKLYPDAPIFVSQHSGFLAEKIAKENNRYVVYCGSKIGDVQEEMEKLMHIPGVYEQYLMFTDDFALDLATSMYRCYEDNMLIDNCKKIYTDDTPVYCQKHHCAAILRKINEETSCNHALEEDGITLRNEHECIHIQADEKKNGLHVYVESFNEEYSHELSVKWKNKILEIADSLP